MSIKKTLITSSVILIAAVGTLLLVNWRDLTAIKQETAELKRLTSAMLIIKEVRYHVVQIQQFLTDVSATHDEAGYRDAKHNLDGALVQLNGFLGLFPRYSNDISELKQQIQGLHDIGLDMAQAYIRGGREAGNRVMQAPDGFDARSEQLAQHLQELVGRLQTRLDIPYACGTPSNVLSTSRSCSTSVICFSLASLCTSCTEPWYRRLPTCTIRSPI